MCVKQLFFLPFAPTVSLFFSLQLQKRKEREEQLEDVIQAYEKIHIEKSNLQRDLDKMVRDIIHFNAPSIRYVTHEPYGSLKNLTLSHSADGLFRKTLHGKHEHKRT